MSESTALAIAKDYPQDKYNLLIPVKTMQELSPLHKVVINEVQINLDPKQKDVYAQSGGLALTKNGLMKLMAAANIQVLESKSIPTQRCNKCIEIAQRTRQAPKCFECPYIDDIAHQVTIAVPEPSGTFRIVKATKEIRMEDSKATMKDSEYKQFAKFKTEHCESKALNRALREGLMIKSTYTADELKKPFAVALVMPNMNDPELKAAMIERFANNVDTLYGNRPQLSQSVQSQAALPQSTVETVIIDDEDDNIDIETGEIIDAEVIGEGTEEETEPLICSDCSKEIKGFTDNKQKEWTVEELAQYTTLNFGNPLCKNCLFKALKAAKEGEN